MTSKPKDITIYVSPTNDIIFQRNDLFIQYSPTSFDITKLDKFDTATCSSKYETDIVLGKIDTRINQYLVISKETKFIGEFLTSKIYQITQFNYVPMISATNDEDKKYLKMMDDFLSRNSLYYSDTLDLTVSIRNYHLQNTNQCKNPGSYIFPYTLENFCWNFSMAKLLDGKYMDKFIYPIINGFVDIKNVTEYSTPNVKYIIMSRKEHKRSGMRFLYRGADSNGHCANFAEIEEIVSIDDQENKINKVYSFSQIRGSIPLIWEQKPSFQLNPPIHLKPNYQTNYECFKKHVEEVFKNYGDLVIINLIDKKKDQLKIGEQYQNLFQDFKDNNKSSHNIDYVWFDFHHECKKMKYQNISKLLKSVSLKNALNKFDYTELEIKELDSFKAEDKSITKFLLQNDKVNFLKVQKGVFRTNCVDSLDRTNVVQTVLARYFLHKIFYNLQFDTRFTGEPFEEFKTEFEKIFKNIWADNGDHISKAYSGTGAMKADFVRTGKRTTKGALVDGKLTTTRFYFNNFCDGYNQDCHDYFLQKISPRSITFKEHNNLNLFIILPSTIFLTIIMFFFMRNIALPEKYESNLKKAFFKALLFVGAFYLSFSVIFQNFKDSLIDTPTVEDSK